ncbi:MAG: hypothetical protein MUO64_19785 [Anaerolineales bacterium]|nr:hypothetical protein [Anaerolineales bacterium]
MARLSTPSACNTTEVPNPLPPTLSTTRLVHITVLGLNSSIKMTLSRAELAVIVRIILL